jgi:hypothetical protein
MKGVWVPVLPLVAVWRFLLHSPLHPKEVRHGELAKNMAVGRWGSNVCGTQKKRVVQEFKESLSHGVEL